MYPVEEAASGGLSWRELLAIAALVTVPRIAGLGHVSLWLDEILGTLQTSGSLAETWEQLKGVRVHPPLWGLLNWLTQQATEVEVLRRLVPIACGIATILFLADFVCRRFDRATACLCAGIAAFSPLHIRYSQELRAYSLGLCLFVLALWVLDRALARGRARDWVAFAVALWAGLSTLYLVAFVVLPGLLLVLAAPKPRAERRRDLRRFAFSLVAAGLAFAPWYGIVGEALEKQHELPATRWTLELVAQRWHFLTAAAQEGERANAGAVVIGLVALAGAAVACRSRAGRIALAGLVAGTLGVELVLVLLGHWSNGRYSLAAWPFLMMILALGCRAAGSMLLSAWSGISGISGNLSGISGNPGPARRPSPVLVALCSLLLVVPAEVLGVGRYYQRGRPDWLSLAGEVALAMPSPRTVRVSNDWTRISLGYYLSRLEGGARPGVSTRVEVVGIGREPGESSADPSCGLLVDAGYPERRDLDDLFGETPGQKSYPRTGARLVALPIPAAGSDADPWRCYPRELEVAPGERSPSIWGIPLRRSGQRARLEMVEADASQLLFGWSFAERNRAGISFRWMVGHWSAIRLPVATGRLRVRAWSFEEGQRLTVYRNRSAAAEVILRQQPQEIELAWPLLGTGVQADAGDPGEIVHLHVDAVAPKERLGRPLAAGFDAIALVAGDSPQPPP